MVVAVFRQMPNCTKTECVFVVGFPSRGVTGVLGDGNMTAIWNNTGYDSWNMGGGGSEGTVGRKMHGTGKLHNERAILKKRIAFFYFLYINGSMSRFWKGGFQSSL